MYLKQLLEKIEEGVEIKIVKYANDTEYSVLTDSVSALNMMDGKFDEVDKVSIDFNACRVIVDLKDESKKEE